MSKVIEVEIEGKTASEVRGIAAGFNKLADYLEQQEKGRAETETFVALVRAVKGDGCEAAIALAQ